MLLKISENVDFGQNFRKISILVKIFENIDFGQNSWNSRIIFKQSWFWRKFSYILTFVSISGNYLDFGQNFWTSRLWVKFQIISILVNIFGRIFILVKIFEKSVFLSKILKILLLVNSFSLNHNFGRNFWKISILGKIFEKSRFCSIFFQKRRFYYKYSKISILVNICENLDIVQNLRKSWIWLKFSENFDSDQYFWKITSLLKLSPNEQHYWKSRFRLKLFENLNFCNDFFLNLDFHQNFRKILIFVTIYLSIQNWRKNFDFNQFCQRNFYFSQKFLQKFDDSQNVLRCNRTY